MRFSETSALGRYELPVSGLRAALVPRLPAGRDLRCAANAPRVGGEGFAFVLQWEGTEVAAVLQQACAVAPRGRLPRDHPA